MLKPFANVHRRAVRPALVGGAVCAVAALAVLLCLAVAAPARAADAVFSDPNELVRPITTAKSPLRLPTPPAARVAAPARPAATNAPSRDEAVAGTNAPVAEPGATNVPAALVASLRTMETLDDKHKLALGDRLSFRIIEDQEDPNESLDPKPVFTPFLVTDSGDVEIPLLGRYPAAGKTCKQLAFEIKGALEQKYYYQATVIIALDQITKNTTGRVYVTGQVRAVGAIEIPADETFTLSKAVLRAGGFTEYADKKHVRLSRRNDTSGVSKPVEVNLYDVFEKGKTELDIKLEPGDLIFVPARWVVI